MWYTSLKETNVMRFIVSYFAELGSIIFFLLFLWVLYSDLTDRSYSCLYKLLRVALAFIFAVLSAICFRYK